METREIKFRAWQSKTKRWINPLHFLVRPDGRVVSTVLPTGEHPEHIILISYTGLKDKNGKEIYEGDIVFEIYKGNYVFIDTFKKEKLISLIKNDIVNPCMMLHRQNVKNKSDWEYDFVKCGLLTLEVIGNIYQNPELLK